MNYLIENKTYKTMNRIRLTESQLHTIIRKCVNEALENNEYTINNPHEIYLPNLGETYYVWYNGMGDFYGTSDIEHCRGNISNGRKKQVFRKQDGFETVDDVEEYVLNYFDR